MSDRRVELTIRRSGHEDMTVQLPNGTIHIGRAEDSGLVLPDIAVSRRHAKLLVSASGVVVEDVGSGNGTYFEGKPIRSRELEDGDEILIDPFVLVFAIPRLAEDPESTASSQAQPPAVPRVAGVPRLVLVQGQGLKSEYPLREGGLGLGRSEQREVILPDPAASRSHAEIVLLDGRWCLRDHGSVNGTFVNGGRIREHFLQDGDRLRIGATEFRFADARTPPEGGSAPPDPPAPSSAAGPPPAAPSPGTRPFESLIFEQGDGQAPSASVPVGAADLSARAQGGFGADAYGAGDSTFVPPPPPPPPPASPAQAVSRSSLLAAAPPPRPGPAVPPAQARPAPSPPQATHAAHPQVAPGPVVAPPAPSPQVAAPPPSAPHPHTPAFAAPVPVPLAPPPGGNGAPPPVHRAPAPAPLGPPAGNQGFVPVAPPPRPVAAAGGFGAVEMDVDPGGKRKKGRKMKMSGGGKGGARRQGSFMERNIRRLIIGFALVAFMMFGVKVVKDGLRDGPKVTRPSTAPTSTAGTVPSVVASGAEASSAEIDRLIGEGNAHFRDKHYLEAVEKYAAVQKLNPANATATKMGYHACEFLVVQSMYNTIVQRSSTASDQQAAYDAAVAQAEEAIGSRRGYPAAMRAIQDVQAVFPDDEKLVALMDTLKSKQRGAVVAHGRYTAEKHLQMVQGLFDTASGDRGRGDAMAAIQGFERVLAADPDKKTELYWKAEEQIREVKSELSARGRAAYRSGISAMKTGDYLSARGQFRETLRLDPFNQVAQRRLSEVQAKLDQQAQKYWSEAEIYEKTNQLEMAIGRYRKVMEYSESTSSALSLKAKKRIDALLQ